MAFVEDIIVTQQESTKPRSKDFVKDELSNTVFPRLMELL